MQELSFLSADRRLRLHGFDHGPKNGPLTILCMGGLTRNSLDFTDLAKHLSGYRVLAVDQRGRGRSEWDPNPANYTPAAQAGDMFALLDKLEIARVVLVGTSNGGLMSMIMGATQPSRVAGIILNDIGPEIPIAALKRISLSLAGLPPVKSWDEAADQARQVYEVALPNYTPGDWEDFAHRTYRKGENGTPVVAYDPALAQTLHDLDFTKELPDLWSLWPAIEGIPILAIRGAVSDILTKELLSAMVARHPRTQAVEVPDRGHVPMLDEPVAQAAIDAFLHGLEQNQLTHNEPR